MEKITEQPSRFDHLEQMSVAELLQHINAEDSLVAEAVRKAIPQIESLVEAIEPQDETRWQALLYRGRPADDLVCSMPASCLQLLGSLAIG